MYPSIKTFGIPELVEMILEHATPQDVLLWQRVSKTWHDMIQTSTPLQEKLYFRIKPCKNENEQFNAVWNPLTELLFAPNYSPNICCLAIANDAFSGKASHPTASWRRMLMTSPATTWMRVWKFNVGFYRCSYGTPVACESGITIGKLAETLEGRNVNYAANENGQLAGFASRFDEDCCTCSLWEDQQARRKAANLARKMNKPCYDTAGTGVAT